MSTTKNWHAQMVKSQDTAREQNRREQRRLKVQLDQKSGPEFAAKYRLKELNREQRIISRELDRIRKGVHKPLSNEYAAYSSFEKRDVFRLSGFKSTVISYSPAETNLYRTMVFMQNNPSALVPIVDAHSHSQEYFDTIQRCTPGYTPSPREQFVPNYLKRFKDTHLSEEKNLYDAKYSAILYRQSPALRKNNPVTQERKTLFNGNGPVVTVVKQIEVTHVPSPRLNPKLQTNKTDDISNINSQAVNIIDEKLDDKNETEQVVKDMVDNEKDMVDATEKVTIEDTTNKPLNPILSTKDNNENNLDLQMTGSNSLSATSRSLVVSANRFEKEVCRLFIIINILVSDQA